MGNVTNPYGPSQPPVTPALASTEVLPAPRWGVAHAIGSLLGFVVISFGLALALPIVLGVDAVTASIIATPVAWLSLAGWPLLVTRRRGNGVRADLHFTFRRVDIGIGLLGAVVVFACAAAFVVIYAEITGTQPTSNVGTVATNTTASWQVYWLAAIAVLAPFVEELHFRGMWWSALRRRGLPSWLTLLVTALLFAGIHLEPARLALLFAAGLVLGFVRMKTDRLGPSIVVHLIMNGIAAVSLLSLA
jgi:membrane protease YdiL (CAAX protease family)